MAGAPGKITLTLAGILIFTRRYSLLRFLLWLMFIIVLLLRDITPETTDQCVFVFPGSRVLSTTSLLSVLRNRPNVFWVLITQRETQDGSCTWGPCASKVKTPSPCLNAPGIHLRCSNNIKLTNTCIIWFWMMLSSQIDQCVGWISKIFHLRIFSGCLELFSCWQSTYILIISGFCTPLVHVYQHIKQTDACACFLMSEPPGFKATNSACCFLFGTVLFFFFNLIVRRKQCE